MATSSVPYADTIGVTMVGCGNIGSRLLQSLASVRNASLDICGVEPFESARAIAASRFEEARGDRPHRLMLIEEAAGGGQLGVIATDSRNRLDALRVLASKGLPKVMVLEKFLFTRAADYQEAADILARDGVEAWVNCSRNEWPGYVSMRDRLDPASIRSIRVEGSDWSLACNGIHYLALVEFLTRSCVVDLGWRSKPVPRAAKRPTYMELTGTLEGRTESGVAFSVASLPDGDMAPHVTVETDSNTYVVHEFEGIEKVDDGRTIKEMPFRILLASQLGSVFEKLLSGEKTTLPSYSDAARLHLIAMEAMNEGFFGTRSLDVECPVT